LGFWGTGGISIHTTENAQDPFNNWHIKNCDLGKFTIQNAKSKHFLEIKDKSLWPSDENACDNQKWKYIASNM
jgi:hypothetical protein